ncbi:hypothetical protein [Pseudonocardia sp. HH130630-07]|uniref:hypothetical protein n=1 Tax=Pseudonocardia sp. HH130630-07 TaxID=1690815 RepID=UPI0008152FC3|nr:hypothetical protein [Pseudonocardia sp. HH130630-07]ANY10629.1 hypothetical protein AFB00_29935 [Pseudonocardia sp. HH130630-07]
MTGSLLTIAGLALIVGFWLWFHKDAPKTTVFFFLIAGIGIGGLLGSAIGQLINAAMGTVGTATGNLIGIGTSTLVTGLALVATLEVVIKGMHPRKARTKRWHAWLALALPTIVVASGLPVVTAAMDMLSTGAASVGQAFNGLG